MPQYCNDIYSIKIMEEFVKQEKQHCCMTYEGQNQRSK